MKNCLYFTSDLMFSSQVKPVAVAAGYEVRFPGFEEADWDSADLIVIDLEFVSAEDLSDLMDRVREKGIPLSRVVAYGPHVKTAKLEAARQAGVEQVWSRGQFHKSFSTLFGA